MRKLIAISLAFVLLFGLVGPASASDEPAQATDVTTLTVFIDKPNTVPGWKWGDDEVSREITRQTGIRLEVTNATTTDHQELATLLSSGKFAYDIIVTNMYGAMPNMLITQGFAAPLNRLADEYCPEFWDVLPTDEDKVLNWDDGNLYYVVDQFGDVERLDELKEPFSPQASFLVNTQALKELGNPSISNFEELKDVLKQVKAQYGTAFPLYDGNISNANSEQNLAQVINRLMGGTNVYSIQEDGTVQLNFQDEAYYKAVKYINSLYREGLINAENFTVTPEQFKQLMSERQVFAYIGHFWQVLSGYDGGLLADAPYQCVDYPIASDTDPKDVKLLNSYCSVGVENAVFINVDSKNQEDAIRYLTYLLSDAGQIVTREGVKDVTYTLDDEGIPHPTQLRLEYESGPVDKLLRELGMNNQQVQWIPSMWIYSLARHLRIDNEPYYAAFLDTARPYSSWERLNILSGILTDAELMATYTQIITLWNNALPSLYLANSDSEFEAAYEKLIGDAKMLGLEKLEAAYTANYTKYLERGVQ